MNVQKAESEPEDCRGEDDGTAYVEEEAGTVAARLHLGGGMKTIAGTIRLYTERERGRRVAEVEKRHRFPLLEVGTDLARLLRLSAAVFRVPTINNM